MAWLPATISVHRVRFRPKGGVTADTTNHRLIACHRGALVLIR